MRGLKSPWSLLAAVSLLARVQGIPVDFDTNDTTILHAGSPDNGTGLFAPLSPSAGPVVHLGIKNYLPHVFDALALAVTYFTNLKFFWFLPVNFVIGINQPIILHGREPRTISMMYNRLGHSDRDAFNTAQAMWATIFALDFAAYRSQGSDHWTPASFWVYDDKSSIGSIDSAIFGLNSGINSSGPGLPETSKRDHVTNNGTLGLDDELGQVNGTTVSLDTAPLFIDRRTTDQYPVSRGALIQLMKVFIMSFMQFGDGVAVSRHYPYGTRLAHSVSVPHLAYTSLVVGSPATGDPIPVMRDMVECVLQLLQQIIPSRTFTGFRARCFLRGGGLLATIQVSSRPLAVDGADSATS